MDTKSCFFIGHRESSEEIYPVLYAAVDVYNRQDCSIYLADLEPVVILQGKQGVHEPHIGVYIRDGEGMRRDIQYLG